MDAPRSAMPHVNKSDIAAASCLPVRRRRYRSRTPDVLGVAVPEPKDGAFDLAHAAEMSVAHRPGAVVGVRARAFQSPGTGLGSRVTTMFPVSSHTR